MVDLWVAGLIRRFFANCNGRRSTSGWPTDGKSVGFLQQQAEDLKCIVNEVVMGPGVFLVYVQTRCSSEETLDLVGTFSALIELRAVNGLERT
jgi:hypothetical protein